MKAKPGDKEADVATVFGSKIDARLYFKTGQLGVTKADKQASYHVTLLSTGEWVARFRLLADAKSGCAALESCGVDWSNPHHDEARAIGLVADALKNLPLQSRRKPRRNSKGHSKDGCIRGEPG